MHKRIKIARTGRFTDMRGTEVTFDRDFLQSLADSYDPKTRHCPLVKGHPRVEDPAYGWVDSLECADDGLYALVSQVDPAFEQEVRDGRYKYLSPEIYTAAAPGNPDAQKRPYLKHVGFLGAVQPAIDGLGAVSLADRATDPDSEGMLVGELVSLADAGALEGWMISGLGRALVRVAGLMRSVVPTDRDTAALTELEQVGLGLVQDGAVQDERAWQESQTAQESEALSLAGARESTGNLESTGNSQTPTEKETGTMEKDDIQEARAALEAERASFAQEQATFRKARQAVRIEALERAGKIVPGQRDLVVSLAAAFAKPSVSVVRAAPTLTAADSLTSGAPPWAISIRSSFFAASSIDTPISASLVAEAASTLRRAVILTIWCAEIAPPAVWVRIFFGFIGPAPSAL